MGCASQVPSGASTSANASASRASQITILRGTKSNSSSALNGRVSEWRVGATRVWCAQHSSITPHACPSRSASTLLHSPAWYLTQYPTRHGHRFRLRIFRHTGRRSARRSRESRTKFRLFVLLQDLCPWSIHSRAPPRLSPWANIFPPLERETLQVVRIVSFLPHFGSHPNCYL